MSREFQVFCGIAEHTSEDFQRVLDRLVGRCDGIHIDLADGVFVPNLLVGLEQVSFPEEEFVEAHLMIANPVEVLILCKSRGVRRVLIHLSSLVDQRESTARLVSECVRDLGMSLYWAYEIGLAPEQWHLKYADGVMFMTVPLGFSSGNFNEGQLDVISRFRSEYPDYPIEVDGGISEHTIVRVKNAGANRVVSTSWIRTNDKITENYEILKRKE